MIAYRNHSPKIAKNVFVAPTASVIGDVEISEGSSIWFGVVLRGDVNPIRIGRGTNIQDLSVIHLNSNDSPQPSSVTIGDNVTVGHRVVLHGCTIQDECLIGIGAILLDHVVVEKNSVVGAGSLVTAGTVIPSGWLAFGRPAKPVRKLTKIEIAGLALSAAHYRELAQTYLA